MTPTTTILNLVSIACALVAATTFWWVGRKEGPGLPFYADRDGIILAKIKHAAARRQRAKNGAQVLIVIASVLAAWAAFTN